MGGSGGPRQVWVIRRPGRARKKKMALRPKGGCVCVLSDAKCAAYFPTQNQLLQVAEKGAFERCVFFWATLTLRVAAAADCLCGKLQRWGPLAGVPRGARFLIGRPDLGMHADPGTWKSPFLHAEF